MFTFKGGSFQRDDWWPLNPIPTGNGLNQSIYSYHVKQAGRKRVKEGRGIDIPEHLDWQDMGKPTILVP